MVIPRDVSVNRDYSNCHRLLFISCRVLYAILVAFLSSLSFFNSHLNLNVNLLQTQPTEGKEQNPKNRSNPIQLKETKIKTRPLAIASSWQPPQRRKNVNHGY